VDEIENIKQLYKEKTIYLC